MNRFQSTISATALGLSVLGVGADTIRVGVQDTVKSSVITTLDASPSGIQLGENIYLFPEAPISFLQNDSTKSVLSELKRQSKAKSLAVYLFPQDLVVSKEGLWYVVKIDFQMSEMFGESIFYKISSRGSLQKLRSDAFMAALSEAHKK